MTTEPKRRGRPPKYASEEERQAARRAQDRAKYVQNREARRAYQREYVRNNRETVYAYNRQWRAQAAQMADTILTVAETLTEEGKVHYAAWLQIVAQDDKKLAFALTFPRVDYQFLSSYAEQ